jgi:hypothetical protein
MLSGPRHTSELTQYLSDVISDVKRTAPTAAQFSRSGVNTFPIPFFGDPRVATVLTVGVNPSAAEFIGRAWPIRISVEELEARLIGYFHSDVPPHSWFTTWAEALRNLPASYQSSAAHLDLCPRPTKAMGSIADWQAFGRLVESDAQWFFKLLPLCKNSKAMLIAGCVTKRWYMHDFIQRVAPHYKYKLTGSAESIGEGRVGFFRLEGPVVDLPVFFCSISPSGNNRRLLIDRIAAHASIINGWLSSDRATNIIAAR